MYKVTFWNLKARKGVRIFSLKWANIHRILFSAPVDVELISQFVCWLIQVIHTCVMLSICNCLCLQKQFEAVTGAGHLAPITTSPSWTPRPDGHVALVKLDTSPSFINYLFYVKCWMPNVINMCVSNISLTLI